jgi:hypothetical protein
MVVVWKEMVVPGLLHLSAEDLSFFFPHVLIVDVLNLTHQIAVHFPLLQNPEASLASSVDVASPVRQTGQVGAHAQLAQLLEYASGEG